MEIINGNERCIILQQTFAKRRVLRTRFSIFNFFRRTVSSIENIKEKVFFL